jgi:hypothetical protein
VLVILLSGIVALTVTLKTVVRDEEHRLLKSRTGEVAALLTSSVTGARSSLNLLGAVYAASPDPQSSFATSASALTAAGARVGVMDSRAGRSPYGPPPARLSL